MFWTVVECSAIMAVFFFVFLAVTDPGLRDSWREYRGAKRSEAIKRKSARR